MISKIIDRVEKTPMTFGHWLAGVTGVLFIRFLLEILSSPPAYVEAYSADRLVHHYLGFVAIAVAFALCGMIFSPRRPVFLGKFIVWGIAITWLPPIFDWITTGGAGSDIEYILTTPDQLPLYYISFFGPLEKAGITLGMRLEILIVLLALSVYVYHQTKSAIKAVFTAWVGYTITFCFFALPSLCLWTTFTLLPAFAIPLHMVDDFSAKFIALILSYIYFFIIFFMGILWFYLYNPQKCLAALKNSRIERVAHYALMAILGAVLAIQLAQLPLADLLLSLLSSSALFLMLYFAWMFSVGVNDMTDIVSDKISNPSRPLSSQILSESDMRSLNIFFLTGALLGGYMIGRYTFFAIMVFIAAYYIYSAPPLRLKRIPILASFLISIASLAAFMAGFFTFNPVDRIEQIPMPWILLILVTFTLASHIRDIKDYEGDLQTGLKTLPVIFGLQRGKIIIAALVAVSFLLVPIILQNHMLWMTSIPCSLMGYALVTRQRYAEWQVFILYFIYAAVSLWIYLN
ncbi:MAG: UbiA family prenyltransferase [Verrucomicrobiota bacterium]